MVTCAFLGLGVMGGPMARHLAAKGHAVTVWNRTEAKASAWAAANTGKAAATPAEAITGATHIFLCLGDDPDVQTVFDAFAPALKAGQVIADHTTASAGLARRLQAGAKEKGAGFIDAPVSGGTAAADAGTLAFMVGCDEADFSSVEETLKPMSRVTIRAGDHGAGQAAKICNNMLLGISMIGTCEAFALAEKLGLAPDRFFEIASKSSGNCWSLSTYAPWPGVGPQTASDRNYEGGFAANMMLKDLKLAQEAAARSGATTPLGNSAEALYQLFDRLGYGSKDFSGVLQMLRGNLGQL